MSETTTNVSTFLIASAIAIGGLWFAAVPSGTSIAQGTVALSQPDAAAKGAPSMAKVQWAASAPGRIEPRDGEARIATLLPGRIASVAVQVNDRVQAGDLLFGLENEDHEARVSGAEAEVAVRTRERDQENVGKLAKDRRSAEDAVAKAERALFAARWELDRLMTAARTGADVDKARAAVKEAVSALDKERVALRKAANVKDIPLPTRLESGLAIARAELSVAETALARSRVRAPIDGMVLQVNAKRGEMAVPQSELPMVIIGDLSKLRVRAEFDERDIDKVRVGQAAVVTTDAFPNRQFEARVTQVAKSLGQPRVSQRGPRRPTDVDVLEVFVELDGTTPLLPGMRADVFLKPDAAGDTPVRAN